MCTSSLETGPGSSTETSCIKIESLVFLKVFPSHVKIKTQWHIVAPLSQRSVKSPLQGRESFVCPSVCKCHGWPEMVVKERETVIVS